MGQIAVTTNKAPGQGIPNSANTQGNSTPDPRVTGYPLDYVAFPYNLSEENNGMMLSVLFNQFLVSRKFGTLET